MIFEPLTFIIGFLVCWLIGTVVYLAVKFIRPILLQTKARLYAIGKIIHKAALEFRDSDATPEVFDKLIDAALLRWCGLSKDLWTYSDKILKELEDMADDLRTAIWSWRDQKQLQRACAPPDSNQDSQG